MKIWNTTVTSLSECDQILLALFAALFGAGAMHTLLSPLGMISGSQIELTAGFVVLSMSLCFGGVFWKRNRGLFVRQS